MSLNQWLLRGRKKGSMGCWWGAACRCHCLWKERWLEDRGCDGKLGVCVCVCVREQEWIHQQEICCPFSLPSLYSAFLFHSPHGWRNGCCCVFIYRPVELLLAVTGHFGWLCLGNASAWLYMSTKKLFFPSLTVLTERKGPVICAYNILI